MWLVIQFNDEIVQVIFTLFNCLIEYGSIGRHIIVILMLDHVLQNHFCICEQVQVVEHWEFKTGRLIFVEDVQMLYLCLFLILFSLVQWQRICIANFLLIKDLWSHPSLPKINVNIEMFLGLLTDWNLLWIGVKFFRVNPLTFLCIVWTFIESRRGMFRTLVGVLWIWHQKWNHRFLFNLVGTWMNESLSLSTTKYLLTGSSRIISCRCLIHFGFLLSFIFELTKINFEDRLATQLSILFWFLDLRQHSLSRWWLRLLLLLFLLNIFLGLRLTTFLCLLDFLKSEAIVAKAKVLDIVVRIESKWELGWFNRIVRWCIWCLLYKSIRFFDILALFLGLILTCNLWLKEILENLTRLNMTIWIHWND